MSNIQLFNFEEKEIRVIELDNEPWFVVSDVLKALSTTTRASDAKEAVIDNLGEDVVINYLVETTSGKQERLLDLAIKYVLGLL